MHRGSGVVVVALVVVAGCIGDKAADLALPETLAIGAYAPVGFGDVCRGSKADLCSNETVEHLESITVDPPGTLEIVPVEQTPSDLLQVTRYPVPYVVHGLASGTSKVCIQALFSDGSHRRDCASVRVDRIAHVTAELDCGYQALGVPAQPLVPAGLTLELSIGFEAADGVRLGGDILHPVDDAALRAQGVASYAWVSPAEGGQLTFGSPLDPAFSLTLETYTAADVTAVVGESTFPGPLTLRPGQGMDVQIAQDVASRRTCWPVVTRIQSQTPDVCLGPDGEMVWTTPAGQHEAWFTAVTAGTCRLALGVSDDRSQLGTLEVPFQLSP